MVAVVTGAGSGIGLATTERLVAEGARVAALDLVPPAASDRVLPIVADVRDVASLLAAAAATEAAFGPASILVCNAGVGSVGTVVDHTDDEWHAVYDINVVGIARTVTAYIDQLRRAPHAAIVCTASVVSTVGLPQRAIYAATKGAVLSLTLSMAADLVHDGIRVNCVCPGTVGTPWVQRLLAQAPDPVAAEANLVARQPVGRLGTADEVADAIVYLAGPQAGFVTGTALAIDGGISGFRVVR
jgi:NAD(P)-dependent dehydrogenase (short-subunit alcohol dehydrogenase family)